jgi:hypothetical protein
MKKVVFLFLLAMTHYAGAQEMFKFNINSGNFYGGMNFSSNQDVSEFSFDLLNIGMEHYTTRIGLEYSPMKYWTFIYTDENDVENLENKISFINFRLYWNTFNWEMLNGLGNFFIGPFLTFNYMMFLRENNKRYMKWDDYIFTAGLRLGLNLNVTERIKYFIIGSETGYRNINGRNNYYININVDFIVGIIVFLGPADSKTEANN